MSGGARLGPTHSRALSLLYLGQIRGEEKCIGSSEIHLDPGDFLYIYVVHCHALSSGPAMARTRNTECATKTHITARESGVVHTRALTTNDFQDLYFLAPTLLPPPLASSCKIGSWEKLLRLIMEISDVG